MSEVGPPISIAEARARKEAPKPQNPEARPKQELSPQPRNSEAQEPESLEARRAAKLAAEQKMANIREELIRIRYDTDEVDLDPEKEEMERYVLDAEKLGLRLVPEHKQPGGGQLPKAA